MDRAEKIAVIVGITEAIKQLGIPPKYCPLIAIIIGAIFGYAEDQTSKGILDGIILGATVTGGYTVVKKSSLAVLNTPDKSNTLKADYQTLEPEDDRSL